MRVDRQPECDRHHEEIGGETPHRRREVPEEDHLPPETGTGWLARRGLGLKPGLWSRVFCQFSTVFFFTKMDQIVI